jgi:hypothetical protein
VFRDDGQGQGNICQDGFPGFDTETGVQAIGAQEGERSRLFSFTYGKGIATWHEVHTPPEGHSKPPRHRRPRLERRHTCKNFTFQRSNFTRWTSSLRKLATFNSGNTQRSQHDGYKRPLIAPSHLGTQYIQAHRSLSRCKGFRARRRFGKENDRDHTLVHAIFRIKSVSTRIRIFPFVADIS